MRAPDRERRLRRPRPRRQSRRPAGSLRRAVESLRGAGLEFDALSSLYRTEPWGVTDQPDFVNACALARTRLDPLAPARSRSGRSNTTWAAAAACGAGGRGHRHRPAVLRRFRLLRRAARTLPHPGLLERAFCFAAAGRNRARPSCGGRVLPTPQRDRRDGGTRLVALLS